MKRRHVPTVAMIACVLAGLAGWVVTAQDKYTLKVPDGLALSEFKGYESWQVVALSHSGETLNVIVANPEMINAYASGVPGNGKPFPDGAKALKMQYYPKKSTEAPFDVAIPDRLKDLAFMSKDSKRFANTGGWGYAMFNYDPAADKFTPDGKGAGCGAACHSAVKAKDYVFTAYGKR